MLEFLCNSVSQASFKSDYGSTFSRNKNNSPSLYMDSDHV